MPKDILEMCGILAFRELTLKQHFGFPSRWLVLLQCSPFGRFCGAGKGYNFLKSSVQLQVDAFLVVAKRQ